mmetsp:Transcript_94131/g.252047  ORF Transcript_94131/g.252047 Transcript_94131/m.252047 type:complete len:249 (+) Transcript_94131:740-1486(+)
MQQLDLTSRCLQSRPPHHPSHNLSTRRSGHGPGILKKTTVVFEEIDEPERAQLCCVPCELPRGPGQLVAQEDVHDGREAGVVLRRRQIVISRAQAGVHRGQGRGPGRPRRLKSCRHHQLGGTRGALVHNLDFQRSRFAEKSVLRMGPHYQLLKVVRLAVVGHTTVPPADQGDHDLVATVQHLKVLSDILVGIIQRRLRLERLAVRALVRSPGEVDGALALPGGAHALDPVHSTFGIVEGEIISRPSGK